MESKPAGQPAENASSASILPQQHEEDTLPWFAVRLFMAKPQVVMDYLTVQQLPYFIPMEYVDVEDKDHHIRQQLRPVVRNLVFIKKSKPANPPVKAPAVPPMRKAYNANRQSSLK